MARHCPECAAEFNGKVCHACGYGKKKEAADPDRWRCVHEDRGQRCAVAGVVSPATHGGTFYCWQHVPAMQQMKDGVKCPPPMGFAALRALVTRKIKPFDFEAEGERIALQQEPVT